MYEYSGGPVFPSFLCINSFNFCNTMFGRAFPRIAETKINCRSGNFYPTFLIPN
ncbi:hypothetical protein IX307_002622 [Bacteroides pyogenes]|nr:hypothetical protein [Bacteroides pyogenes]GAE16002.1 hypothetical protein JCM6292_2363 [Bacteroides pyogenes JCM 6292]MBR8717376.1 hypothetical protein [Bacteroides pyogenes]MBR8721399.1 hypothetical protein [Bacteroides pyogenes]MBR8726382.1 hypothetical protein [Bacteroides pyogenes]